MRRLLSLAAIAAIPALPAAGFELSSSYAPRAELVPGYYACRSGLDFSTFTYTFDLGADGRYVLRGQAGEGAMALADAEGNLAIETGPFASDDTAATYGRNTTRLSDGNAVIIIRYDFGDVVTDDYCARVE